MAKHLVQRGHKVSLMLTSDHGKIGVVKTEWDGVQIIECPDLLWGRLRSGWDPWGLINRMTFLSHDKDQYDLVHCFETRPATIYPALYYCHRHKIPFVTDWNDWWGRGGIIDELRPKWYRILFGAIETYYEEAFRKYAAGVTVISSALELRAKAFGIPAERICKIPGGAFPDFFQARPKEICRKRLSLPLSTPIVGYSSMDAHYDLDILIRALVIVAKRYPSVKFLITGKLTKSIINLAMSCGIESNLYLTGLLPYEEVPWYLGCANLFVLPFPDKIYNMGRWPNKVCDYMSLGRPIISNPVGDVKILLESHEIGLLANYDPVDFAEKIIYIIAHPEIEEKLGMNARNVAITIYDWKILIRKLEEFYSMVLL
jgi:glycosyltransferase involved in cell wall biosynthesis